MLVKELCVFVLRIIKIDVFCFFLGNYLISVCFVVEDINWIVIILEWWSGYSGFILGKYYLEFVIN